MERGGECEFFCERWGGGGLTRAATRSSGTGPGFLTIQASVDQGAYVSVGSITQTNTNFNNEFLTISPLTGIAERVVPDRYGQSKVGGRGHDRL